MSQRRNTYIIKKIAGMIILILVDVISVAASLQGALYLRKNILPLFLEFPSSPQIVFTDFWWIYYIWLFFFAYEGLYTKKFSFWDEVKCLWKVSFFSTLGIFTVLYLGKIGEQVSRTVIVLTGFLSLLLIPLIRIYV
jgi:hypothetical protein